MGPGFMECSAANCESNATKNPELTFFVYPNPNDIERAKKWRLNSGRKHLNPQSLEELHQKRLCSLHFEETEFINSQKNSLVQNAVPTLFTVSDSNSTCFSSLDIITSEGPRVKRGRKPIYLTKEELKKGRRASKKRYDLKRINLGRHYDKWERIRNSCGMELSMFIEHLLRVHESQCEIHSRKRHDANSDYEFLTMRIEPSEETEVKEDMEYSSDEAKTFELQSSLSSEEQTVTPRGADFGGYHVQKVERDSNTIQNKNVDNVNGQLPICEYSEYQRFKHGDNGSSGEDNPDFPLSKQIKTEKNGTDYFDSVKNKLVSDIDGENVEDVSQNFAVIANIKKENEIPLENNFDMQLLKDCGVGMGVNKKETIGKDFEEWIKEKQLSGKEKSQNKSVRSSKHMCENCSFLAPTKEELRKHYESHHNSPEALLVKRTKCPIENCQFACTRYYDMVEHTKKVHDFCITGIKSIKTNMMPRKRCSLCNFSSYNLTFVRRHYYEKHNLEEHRPTHFCSICNYGFYSEKGKVAHEKKGCFICPFGCGRFDNHLTKHMETVHFGKSYLCSFCGKSFKKNGTLKNHIEAKHQDGKNYKCTEKGCGKEFNRKSSLEQHSFVHDKKKRLICPVPLCDYRCNQRNSMNWHKKKHTDEEQEYFSKVNIKNHTFPLVATSEQQD